MIRNFTIEGYKRYSKEVFNNLSRINIILGENNIGKSTILEAIYGLSCGTNALPFVYYGILRRQMGIHDKPYPLAEAIWAVFNKKNNYPLSCSFKAIGEDEEVEVKHTIWPGNIFTGMDLSLGRIIADKIKQHEYFQRSFNRYSGTQNNEVFIADWQIEVTSKESLVSQIRITTPNTNYPQENYYKSCRLIDIADHRDQSENARIYSVLKKSDYLEDVIYDMNKVFPYIKSIDYIPYFDNSPGIVSVRISDGNNVPIYNLGDGVQRWYNILGCMALYNNGIVCIDEIDIGLHPNAQLEFSKNLVKYGKKYNNQLFMTTHNEEWVDNFLSGCDSETLQNDVRIITLRAKENEVLHRVINGKDAFDMRINYNMELR